MIKKRIYLLSLVLLPILLFAQNQFPVAINDTVTIVFGEEIQINVLANDYDVEGDKFHLSSLFIPTLESDPDVVRYDETTITYVFKRGAKEFIKWYLIEDEKGSWKPNVSDAYIVFLLEKEEGVCISKFVKK